MIRRRMPRPRTVTSVLGARSNFMKTVPVEFVSPVEGTDGVPIDSGGRSRNAHSWSWTTA
jgi:hypothetical protein